MKAFLLRHGLGVARSLEKYNNSAAMAQAEHERYACAVIAAAIATEARAVNSRVNCGFSQPVGGRKQHSFGYNNHLPEKNPS